MHDLTKEISFFFHIKIDIFFATQKVDLKYSFVASPLLPRVNQTGITRHQDLLEAARVESQLRYMVLILSNKEYMKRHIGVHHVWAKMTLYIGCHRKRKSILYQAQVIQYKYGKLMLSFARISQIVIG